MTTDLRVIPNLSGLYSATEDGRIWAHPRSWNTGKDGHIVRSHGGMWLAPMRCRNGYMKVAVSVDGRKFQQFVHRLVALAWVPNPLNLPQVNHINAAKDDNRAVNLEWCSASQNKRHAVAMGLCPVTPEFLASVRRNVLKAHEATRGKKRIARGAL